MKDYSAMTDFEINEAVAALNPSIYISEDGDLVYLELSPSAAFMGSDYDEVVFDPCNNPADAWPIIVANKITLLWIEKTSIWCAAIGGLVEHDHWGWEECPEMYSENINPLRAAMIVFLMMKGAEKTQ